MARLGIFVKGKNEPMSTFSERLEIAREFLDIKGKPFAEQLGIPYRSYMNYKGGRTPPADVLSKASEVFNINPAWLISGVEPILLDEAETQTSDENQLLETQEDQTDTQEPAPHSDPHEELNEEDVQLRLLNNMLDLQEENRQLRKNIDDLELELHRNRARIRRIVRDSR